MKIGFRELGEKKKRNLLTYLFDLHFIYRWQERTKEGKERREDDFPGARDVPTKAREKGIYSIVFYAACWLHRNGLCTPMDLWYE